MLINQYCYFTILQTSPISNDILLSILCKCLQSKVQRENTDLSLIQSVVETFLSQNGTQCRIFAMIILSYYLDQGQENVMEYVKLTEEDVQIINKIVKCEEETGDILSFLDQVRSIEINSHVLHSFGGLELLGKVIDSSENDEDIEKAAMILEALLK